MALVQILEGTDELAGVGSFAPLGVFAAFQTQAKPKAAKPGLFSRILGGLGKAASFAERNSQNAIQILDAAGRLRGQARQDALRVEDAFDRNIRGEPSRNWFSEEMIPGVPNGLLAAGAGALLLVLLMKRKDPA